MNRYQHIETFAFFVGYPRSGHSLIGACLDAHPNAVISHELDALGLLMQGIERELLFDAICENARTFYERGNEWSGYSYRIEGMWQGRYETIRVIGDKRGGASSRHLQTNPEVLEEVKKLAPKYCIIHVVRNPYDSIATSVIKQEQIQNRKFNNDDILGKVDEFFQKAETIKGLISKEKENVMTICYENMLIEPRKILTDLLLFLNLPVIEEYVNACSAKLWTKPSQSRYKIKEWEPSTINYIQELIKQYIFLEGYTFNS